MVEIYFAGCEPLDFRGIVARNNGNMLVSYYHLSSKDKRTPKFKFPKHFFVDSGAFSAWSMGSFINIEKYCWFCKNTNASYYAVLDAIGNPEKTYENQKFMESKGLNPLPCFHYGEDIKWLEMYCKNYDYICLGGMVPIETIDLMKWLDVIFSIYPNKKFHGFGMTTPSLIKRYPWYSVDSSSWIFGGKSGNLNDFKNNRNAYYKDVLKNPSWIKAFEEMGFTAKDIEQKWQARNEFNLKNLLLLSQEQTLKESQKQLISGFNFAKNRSVGVGQPVHLTQKNLGTFLCSPKKQDLPAVFFKKCIICNFEWECQETDLEKRCKSCGSEIVTSPIKKEPINENNKVRLI